METLSNIYCIFSFYSTQIKGADIKDRMNQLECNNLPNDNLLAGWKALEISFNSNTTMLDACRILSDNGVKMNIYSNMD